MAYRTGVVQFPKKHRGKTLFLISLGVAVIFFLSGPRPPNDMNPKGFQHPADLDAYLLASESRFTDIRPGTEKQIIWANPRDRRKTPFSIVYLHGFSATRQEVAPLCDIVATALSANLFYTRLTGHGRDGAALSLATTGDWAGDAIEALAISQRLGERVIVIGTSFGGTLATWLASQDKQNSIFSLVLVSPNFGLKHPASGILTWPWARYWVPLVMGRNRSWTPMNERHGRYWTSRYPSTALLPMAGVVARVQALDFKHLNTPVLMIFAMEDRIVDSRKTKQLFEYWGAHQKQKVLINASGDPQNHLIVGDIISPENTGAVAQHILSFIRQTQTGSE